MSMCRSARGFSWMFAGWRVFSQKEEGGTWEARGREKEGHDEEEVEAALIYIYSERKTGSSIDFNDSVT